MPDPPERRAGETPGPAESRPGPRPVRPWDWRHAALAVAVAAAVFTGWRLLLFLTDDAYIAFRYASNHRLGLGLVWNPPPFRPVEGYTSWLWVVLLRIVWGLTGIAPPEAANVLSLLLGCGTLFLVYRLVTRMALPERLERHRFTLLSLIFLGTVTNRTFLAWLSSGLETSLFNFCLLLWVDQALDRHEAPGAGRSWTLRVSLAAMLAALARPDGLLAVLATPALLVERILSDRARAARAREAAWAFPLLVPAIHIVWRRWFYGAWLPNTYYAKYTAPWPESGWRYAASFALEYALPVWLLPALAWAVRPRGMSRRLGIVLLTLLAHVAYYTLVIGGDHFEYRVYSQLIPLLFVSFIWLCARLDLRPAAVVTLSVAFIACSWPIPWTHYLETRDLESRRETFHMIRPVAERLPSWMGFYTRTFDELQAWLITHSVCVRHQEHKVYAEFVGSRLPSREDGEEIPWDGRHVLTAVNVGVVGWVFPHVAVIDLLGLNDYIIARTVVPPQETRHMAHERRPPAGYVECFRPDFALELRFPDPPELKREPRPDEAPLTDPQIVDCEARFRAELAGPRAGGAAGAP